MDQNSNQSLQRQSQDLTVSTTPSLQVSAQILSAELKLTALNAKTDLDEFLVTEFSRALLHLPAEAIQAAFRGWRDASPYFPAISDIKNLASHWVRRQKENADAIAARAEQERTAAARASGQLVDFADIKKDLLAIAQFPAEPTERQMRQKKALERLRQAEAPPALQLTREQIEERLAAEREEIRRYEERDKA